MANKRRLWKEFSLLNIAPSPEVYIGVQGDRNEIFVREGQAKLLIIKHFLLFRGDP